MNIVNSDFIIDGRIHRQTTGATSDNHCLRAICCTILRAIDVVVVVVIGYDVCPILYFVVVVIVFTSACSTRFVCARDFGNVHCGYVVGW